MTKIGIRVFPDNIEKVSKLEADYFEAAVRPGNDLSPYNIIKEKILGIHGAILMQECNFMNPLRKKLGTNDKSLTSAIEAADKFHVQYIIFHPGYIERGVYGERCNLRQLYSTMNQIKDSRLLLEIVPVFAYKERNIFPLHSVDDYKHLKEKTGKNIMLDIGHAMINARAMKYDPIQYIGNLIEELDIKIMHIADNDERKDGYEDSHLSIGKGNVPIEEILKQFKSKIELATIEVNQISNKDIELVRKYLE